MNLNTKAFSLPELLVSLSILGVIGSISWLNYKTLKSAKELKICLNEISDLLDYYGSLASLNSTKVELSFNKQDKKIWLKQGFLERPIYQIPKDIVIDSVNFASITNKPSVLELRSDGSASPGTIIFKGEHNECSVVQSLRGLRRISCKKKP